VCQTRISVLKPHKIHGCRITHIWMPAQQYFLKGYQFEHETNNAFICVGRLFQLHFDSPDFIMAVSPGWDRSNCSTDHEGVSLEAFYSVHNYYDNVSGPLPGMQTKHPAEVPIASWPRKAKQLCISNQVEIVSATVCTERNLSGGQTKRCVHCTE